MRFEKASSSRQSRILVKDENASEESVTTVPVTTIDRVWLNCGSPKVGVMKIDTERHEESVIQGARATIEANLSLMPVEATGKRLASHGAWLESLGYCALTLSERHHARPQKICVFPVCEISEEFNEGMVLLVAGSGRANGLWPDIVASRCDLALMAGNWTAA